MAQTIFDEFRELELQPAYLADANRALPYRRVVCDMLGFDDAVYEGVRRLAAKWRAEPSVHGGKRRPAGALGRCFAAVLRRLGQLRGVGRRRYFEGV